MSKLSIAQQESETFLEGIGDVFLEINKGISEGVIDLNRLKKVKVYLKHLQDQLNREREEILARLV